MLMTLHSKSGGVKTNNMRKLILPIAYQMMVEDFMKASGQAVSTSIREFTTTEAALRYKLYLEELEELETAVQTEDRVEQIDAVADLLYILLGSSATRGDDMSKRVLYYLDLNRRLVEGVKKTATSADVIDTLLRNLYAQGVEDYDKAIEKVLLFAAVLGIESHVIQEAFIRVHESNMSKFCTSGAEAVETVKLYRSKGIETYFRHIGGLEIILRREDDKVMKSINYTPVDLKDLVNEEGIW